MNQELKQEYTKFLHHDQKKLASVKKKIRQLALFRLLAFLGIPLSLIYLPKISPLLAYAVAIGCTVVFFYWIKVFLKQEKAKWLYSNLIAINEKELQALDEEYSQFENGAEFTDPHHHYTYDLDIFGEGSLFQFINRTVTQLGKKQLAQDIEQANSSTSSLKIRQEGLLELAKYTRWRQFYAAKGHVRDEQDLKLLEQITQKIHIKHPKQLGRLLVILPIITLLSFAACAFFGLPWILFLLSVVINIVTLASYRKTIQDFYNLFGSQSKLLGNYQELLLLIEEKTFETQLLKEHQSQLFSEQHETASKVLRRLTKTMARFDYRQNILVGFILNSLALWDLRCCVQLYDWQNKHKDDVKRWFKTIAHFDALSSWANLNHNHPEWTLPKFEDGEFHLTANNLKHPLIKAAKCIGNDFRMNGESQITIITGANMAGKSTFLRTIGVNMLLAMNGCRVNASWFSMKPISLFTNMRTTDNLQNDESYFFAELQRLKAILDEIKSGQPVFVIIDEMLKGTNSEDKLSGSIKLIEQLLSLKAVGVVATHDLKLTELQNDYPKQITNKCFEIQLTEEELLFDYKLTDGVTSTMNANFLMRKMGIIAAN
ncbi:MutS-related protein [Sunxiuqinia elliptica]|uniref:MutS-like protein n=1 Tax=Sunxiuqinia elliptica TaxID=655355 RepID=A0A4V3BYZ4_9BACT|nr:hypothetical protein [Sunxiuqinia elliptica]TDO04659.1 MutS-like protein [Sunxiuqinia elliptica]TDO64207.1 MutS-like protein [Sunxiuqinia elliptica]